MKKKVGQFVTQFQYFMLATLFLMSGWTFERPGARWPFASHATAT